MYKTIGLSGYRNGAEVLIYAIEQYNMIFAGGNCDIWTKPYSGTEKQLSEIEIIKEFWDIHINKKSGKYIFKDTSNLILASGEFKKGKQIKLWKNYYSNGTLKNEIDYKNNVTTQYYDNSNLDFINTVYKDSSVCFTYSKDKFKLLIYKWVTVPNDSGSTLNMYKYYENGNIEHIEAQLNVNVWHGSMGHKTGVYADYYINGACKEVGNYFYDKKVGVWRTYDVDGKLNTEITY